MGWTLYTDGRLSRAAASASRHAQWARQRCVGTGGQELYRRVAQAQRWAVWHRRVLRAIGRRNGADPMKPRSGVVLDQFEWDRARAKALARAGDRCQAPGCSWPTHLNVHHIRPKSEGGALYDLSNLVVLCPNHHAEAHDKLNAAKRKNR